MGAKVVGGVGDLPFVSKTQHVIYVCIFTYQLKMCQLSTVNLSFLVITSSSVNSGLSSIDSNSINSKLKQFNAELVMHSHCQMYCYHSCCARS